MNLEQLRKQAKELVKAARALVLAREHGYRSWPELVVAAEASVDGFLEAATSGRRERAEALLAARPGDRARPVDAAGARAWLGRRSEPAGRTAELGTDPLRLPFGLCERRAPP